MESEARCGLGRRSRLYAAMVKFNFSTHYRCGLQCAEKMGRVPMRVKLGSEPIPAVVDKGSEPVGKNVERQFERKYQGEKEVEDIKNAPGLVERAILVRDVVVELHLYHI